MTETPRNKYTHCEAVACPTYVTCKSHYNGNAARNHYLFLPVQGSWRLMEPRRRMDGTASATASTSEHCLRRCKPALSIQRMPKILASNSQFERHRVHAGKTETAAPPAWVAGMARCIWQLVEELNLGKSFPPAQHFKAHGKARERYSERN